MDTCCYQLINTLSRSPHQQDVDGECADHTIDSDDPLDRDHIVEVQVLKRACYEVCHLLPLLDLVTLTIVANSDWNTQVSQHYKLSCHVHIATCMFVVFDVLKHHLLVQALHPGCNKNKGAFFKHHLKHGFSSDRKVPGTWRLNACRKESLSDALKLMCTECNTDALERVILRVEVV